MDHSDGLNNYEFREKLFRAIKKRYPNYYYEKQKKTKMASSGLFSIKSIHCFVEMVKDKRFIPVLYVKESLTD